MSVAVVKTRTPLPTVLSSADVELQPPDDLRRKFLPICGSSATVMLVVAPACTSASPQTGAQRTAAANAAPTALSPAASASVRGRERDLPTMRASTSTDCAARQMVSK